MRYVKYCGCCTKKYDDALKHYQQAVEDNKDQINKEFEKQDEKNHGVCFVVFRSK